MQWDDPLDAIAVHAWNGTWGVIAVGMFASADLITNSYGTSAFDGSQRPYGFIFPGGGGHLLCAQIAYALFICGMLLNISHLLHVQCHGTSLIMGLGVKSLAGDLQLACKCLGFIVHQLFDLQALDVLQGCM